MELAFHLEVDKLLSASSSKFPRDWLIDDRLCCSVSSRNIVAFSAPCSSDKSSCLQKEICVCVCDLDKPWVIHKVLTTQTHVVALKWHICGFQLLVADADGRCEVWEMKEHLLNSWQCLGSVCYEAEEILSVAWLHNGLTTCINADKKDSIFYQEKFTKVKFSPSVSSFGGKATDGFILVMASGLISVSLLQTTDQTFLTASEGLSSAPLRLCLADIGYINNGAIRIIASDGLVSSAVQCYQIQVTVENGMCKLSCHSSGSLYVKCSSDTQTTSLRLTHLQYVSPEVCDMLLMAYGSQGTSCIEVWHLVEQTFALHKIFVNNAKQDSCFKTMKWMHVASISHNSMLSSLAGPKISVTRGLSETGGIVTYIIAAYCDGSVKLIHRHSFQVLLSTSLTQCLNQTSLPRFVSHFNILEQTLTGCGIVGLHESGLYLYRAVNQRDSPVQVPVTQVVMLLEYCMVAAFDWWDVLLAMRQGMVEGVCQRLQDLFHKQPFHVQNLLNQRFSGMKLSLYQTCFGGQIKAADWQATMVLNGIAMVMHSILRPKSIAAQDKSPGERLAALCAQNVESDVDKFILSLESQDCIVDQLVLQSLKQLTQWVVNFTLHLLAAVPHAQVYSQLPGATIIRDGTALSTLRELLVTLRIWSMIHPGLQPTVMTSSTVDCLPLLFNLVSRVWMCIKEAVDFDTNLVDECCMLPSKIFIPSLDQSFVTHTRSDFLLTEQLPLVFTVDEEPEFVVMAKQMQLVSLPDLIVENNQKHDIIHQTQLGTCLTGNVKECSRCGCMTRLSRSGKVAILQAWEQRWARFCLCGGHWALLKP